MHVWRVSVLIAACLAALSGLVYSADSYIGVYTEPHDEPFGVLVGVVPGAPAALSGLRDGDVIIAVNGVPFETPGTPLTQQFTEAVSQMPVGGQVTFTVYRDLPEFALSVNGALLETDYPLQELPGAISSMSIMDRIEFSAARLPCEVDIIVTAGLRPGAYGEPFPVNAKLACDIADRETQVREFLNTLVDRASAPGSSTAVKVDGYKRDVRSDTDDLWLRLNERATPNDGTRLTRPVYLLRDGLKCEAVTRAITQPAARACDFGVDGYPLLQAQAAGLLDLDGLRADVPALRAGLTAEEHLDVLQLIVETAALYIQEAFAGFTPEELTFIASQREELTDAFPANHYIDREDEDPQRAQLNTDLVQLAGKLKLEPLLLAQLTLAEVANAGYLDGLKRDLLSEFAGHTSDDLLLERDTPYGKLVITGTESSWRQGNRTEHQNVCVQIDLGGDDFYATTAGSGISLEQPVGLLIDLGGDDAYESTMRYSQGSGSMGCGLLIDVSGDDVYTGLEWSQGCGFFGCGALIDMAGDDTYRGLAFCQAAAIFGTGLLYDISGDDRCEAQMKSQAFGGSRGIGLLIDVSGDDYRYAKGKYPTGYGDPGVFDAWSQGCAMGFRGIASGGIAGVIDLAGSDYNEAGNFSQGGGYYFGYGFFHDLGWEDDRYLGSRYNQGFCAHQAIGVFLEEGGDDTYSTRQAVAQGLAWDECCTMFIDYAGDDTYNGGGGFSQGASAHNALCVMWDRNGRDSYKYAPGQARAGGNDYHGGTSLSLFIDEGGAKDYYNAAVSGNNLVSGWPEYGFFADLPGTLAEALAEDAWVAMWRAQE